MPKVPRWSRPPPPCLEPPPARARRIGSRRRWASRELAPEPGGLDARPDQFSLDPGELPLGLVGPVVLLVSAVFGAISALLGLVGALALAVQLLANRCQ